MVSVRWGGVGVDKENVQGWGFMRAQVKKKKSTWGPFEDHRQAENVWFEVG